MKQLITTALTLALTLGGAFVRADDSFAQVSQEVNQKMVKVFGAGGLKGLASYGTGFMVSPDGYILTANSHILDTQDLRVHTYDGTRYHAKLVCIEPELDVALIKIGNDKDKVDDMPFFDINEAFRRPTVETGTGILAFSNLFNIAVRNEEMSVQRGVVAAYSRLHGRSGIFEAPYTGFVYVIDAITNGPGAAGGALTTRKGELVGIVGKELRNELTNTWINYAIPINAVVDVTKDNKTIKVSVLDLIDQKEKYKSSYDPNKPKNQGGGGYSGIVLVPNVVERTPPYVDGIMLDSPAARAGLKPDDLIVYVEGLPVNSIQVYQEMMDRYRPGTEVKLDVRRGEKFHTLTLKLADQPRPPKP